MNQDSNLLKELSEKWPSAVVARSEVRKFSGGLLSEKTLANLDSRGEGPTGRIRVERKVCYPVAALITWLEGRAQKLN
jgi:hypothetical protein